MRDRHQVEIILADSISHALQRVLIDRPVYFVAWLAMIARNRAFRLLRDLEIEGRVFGDLASRARSERSAFAEAISREALDLFDRGIEQLTKSQRRVLLLRIVDHLSFDEIGARLKMRPGAARSHAQRAKGRLTEWVGYMRAL